MFMSHYKASCLLEKMMNYQILIFQLKYPNLYTCCVKYLDYIEHDDSPDLEALAVPKRIVSFSPI